MQKEIKHQWHFNHPPQDVWDYLTKPELMQLWLMKNDFAPVVGHDFHFWTGPMPQFNLDGTFYCKVLEVVPCKKLLYSWKGGPGKGEITLDSLVEWTLYPKENGTELFLLHTGFSEMEAFNLYSAMEQGWLKNIKKINELLNTRHAETNR